MTPIRKFLFWLTYLLILPGLLILRYQGTEALAPDGWVDLFQERNGAYISENLKYQLRK